MAVGTINKEYDKYHSRPEQIKNRDSRNKAHRMAEAFYGKDIKGDVDHTKPMSKGGKTTQGNLRVTSASQNRSFARNKDGSLKSQTSKRERRK